MGWFLVAWLACEADPAVAPPEPEEEEAEQLPGVPERPKPGPYEPSPILPDIGHTPEEDEAYEAFFDLGVVHEVRVSLAARAVEELDDHPREYVDGAFEIDGETLDPVGVRLKGSTTFQTLDGKPSIKIKFNEYVAGQTFAGLERIALNNMTSDPAQGREALAYTLWAAGGMAVPRVTFAKVYVNDVYYGLYTVLEGMDDRFLARRWTLAGGDLWAGNDGAEFSSEGIAFFVLNSGWGDVSALERAAAVMAEDTDDFFGLADTVLEMDQFVDYWAWTMLTGTNDGYPDHLNDFFVYGDPGAGGRFEFLPWGLDETWADDWHFSWGQGDSVGHRCRKDAACVGRLRDRLLTHLDTFEAEDPVGLADRCFALTEDAMHADTRKPFLNADVDLARAHLRTMLVGWEARVRGEVGM